MKKHIVITIIALLMTAVAYGMNQPLPGNGTASDPYLIDSQKEWDLFVEYVNSGGGGSVQYVYEGKYIKLNADLTVDASVGVDEAYFSGNFDGNGHVITLNMAGERHIALFNFVDGKNNTIEIKNLTVDGTITTTSQYAAGFVSQVWNKLKITSCTSSVTISSAATGRLYYGGFVGIMHEATEYSKCEVTCKFCVFDGSILTENASCCAGFIGFVSVGSSLSILESTQAYQSIVGRDFKTFFQIDSNATQSNTNINVGTNASTCYYLRVGDASWHNVDLSVNHKQLGKEASTKIPANKISKKYTRAKTNYYVPQAYVSGMATIFSAGTEPTEILDPAPVVSYYGKALTYETHYNYTIDNTNKKVIFNATGDSNGVYYGSGYSVGYTIVDVRDWGKLKAALSSSPAEIKVLMLDKKEYKPASGEKQLAIEGSGAVYLYLNGCTLNRGLKDRDGVEQGAVLFIGSKGDVTIYGEGVITGGNNVGSGGGIRCQGKLQVYNVTFANNEANYLSDKDYGTGGGIYCSGSLRVVGGEFCFNKSHGGGGGINGTGSSFYVEGVSFHDNYCNSKGGGIRVKSNGAIIKDCVIVDNELEEHEDLESASDGGGIHNDGCNPLTVINCTISRNNAYRWGGGVFSRVGTVYLEGCTIQQNTSSENGGGIYINEGRLTLRNSGTQGSTITENVSNNTGGVFVATSGNFYLSGTVQIINNIGTSIKKNVFFANNNGKLNVVGGDLDASSGIGVSRNNVGVITAGLSSANEKIKRCIASDNYKNYWVLRPKSGEVSLAASFDWSHPTVSNTDYAYWRVSGSTTNYVTWAKKTNTYTILAPIILPSGYKYTASSITIADDGHIFIEDGGELVCPTASVQATILRDISAAAKVGNEVYGWNIISSPVTDALLTGAMANVNVVTANSVPYNFDLLYYDEPKHYWRSYTSGTSGTYFPDHKLKLATGYLYRNIKDFTIEYGGLTNYGSVDCEVTASCDIAAVRGFNLIGNPYTHSIYKGSGCAIDSDVLNAGYYRLNSSGGWDVVADNVPIKSCEGVLVQAKKGGGKVTIVDTDSEPKESRYNNDNIKFIVSNSEFEDAAYAMFNQSTGLNKMEHINSSIPMIYISHNDEDYAIATFNDSVAEFNLNFKAKTTGRYTLSYELDGEFDYLHVIDCLAGEDVDMLAEGKYSFIGSPYDTEARFIVRLQYKPDYDGDDIFAYQSGNDIVVSGEGELQVFDVMGRLVAKQYVSGVETMSTSVRTGVYILRLNGKTQKIVIK